MSAAICRGDVSMSGAEEGSHVTAFPGSYLGLISRSRRIYSPLKDGPLER